ncbi:MAG: hypothetical protein GW762_02135 [Candidatus Pacebacteria bacterium]|nr:hypothetical protein [Candidatus Paceibacterota bacterium]PIR63555.1 MAG: hypothetical protein COU64_03805 [Candidatus Pacebacteria bacterium CG10_big_fil_rev_8_21_14_0_10_40_26]PIZ79211.1 MAG: hypothetical protein COY01_02180 [Candidatus Pacebacteria bacterium CG_4_10_14_0_2_um_filter_40_20]PJA68866.1 MAG: hypothetical protein CO156_02785 [Candidatus Pacebacteria bacterium CG_4_9_14_3_um_filter_40_12]PJC42178.1 MAG: hypothetical protein CO041_00890 [Candidatus Pacebacteria bacterium CG_4_9_
MKELEDLRPGIEYALLSQKQDGTIFPLFAGVAGYVTDDFMAAGIVTSLMNKGVVLGIRVNDEDDPQFLKKVRALR